MRVKELAELAGTTMRTVRYYHKIGLLPIPAGLRPRSAWPAWAPLAASGVLALLGRLLDIPQPVRDLGIFQHVPGVRGLGHEARREKPCGFGSVHA